MRTRIIGIVLVIVSLGIDAWLAAGLASGSRGTGVALGFVLFSLPFLAVGVYLILSSRGEVKAESKADKERAILNSVMTRGRVTIPDLAIEGDLSRDQVRDYIYDIIGKDLFRGYVNWEKGELVSAEAAQIKDGTCPNCGGHLELAGKGLVRCPYCGTETYLSPLGSAPPPPSPVEASPVGQPPPATGSLSGADSLPAEQSPSPESPSPAQSPPPASPRV
jgi:hypothetical protein